MEIIKKVNKTSAWVSITDTEAILMTFDEGLKDNDILEKANKYKAKKDRILYLERRIEEIKSKQ